MNREDHIKLLNIVGEVQLETYRRIRMFLDSDPKTLGYRNHEHMVRDQIARCDKDCEKLMKPFDRGDF